MNTTVWERRECVSAELEDSLVLLDLDTLVYHSLNKTAGTVWELLAQPRSVDSLVEDLCTRYKVEPAQCRESVERLLAELASKKLVKEAGPAATDASAPAA